MSDLPVTRTTYLLISAVALTTLPAGCVEVAARKSPVGVVMTRAAHKPHFPGNSRQVDLGVLSDGAPPKHVFSIANTTDTPLCITKISKTCGCETTDLTEGTVIRPGGEQQFSFELGSGAGGRKSGRMVIDTDSVSADLRRIEISLAATVPRELQPIPSIIVLRGSPGAVGSQQVRIASDSTAKLSAPVEIDTLRGLVVAREGRRQGNCLVFDISPAQEKPPGIYYDIVYMTFQHLHPVTTSFMVRVEVQ